MEDIEIIAMPKKRGRPAKQENTEDMIRLYEQGKTLQEIADMYGVSIQAVRYRLKKNNISRRKPGRLRSESLNAGVGCHERLLGFLFGGSCGS